MILPYLFAALGFFLGLKLPDIDLTPVLFMRHRSAWSHGVALPVLLGWVAGLHPWAWWAVVGALPGVAVHLLMDLFPKSWEGASLIKFAPLPGHLSPIFSFAWIACGVWGCWDVFMRLV